MKMVWANLVYGDNGSGDHFKHVTLCFQKPVSHIAYWSVFEKIANRSLRLVGTGEKFYARF